MYRKTGSHQNAGAKEPHAGYNLRSNPRCLSLGSCQRREQNEQGRTCRYERVGAQTRRALPPFAFSTDHRTKYQGGSQTNK